MNTAPRMKKLALLTLVVSISVAAPGVKAQSVAKSVSNLLPGATKTQAPAPSSADDPLDGEHLRDVLGFLQTATSRRLQDAANYLQMSAARRQSQGPEVSEKLKALMDGAFVGSLRHLSTNPEGNPEDAPTSRISASFPMETRCCRDPVRVNDPNSGKIWLFSSETPARCPNCMTTSSLTSSRTSFPKPGPKCPSGNAAVAMAGTARCDSSGTGDWLGVGSIFGDSTAALSQVQAPAQPAFLQPHVAATAPLFQRICSSRDDWIRRPALAAASVLFPRGLGSHQRGIFLVPAPPYSLTMQRLRIHAISAGRIGTGTLMVLGERLLTAVVVTIAVLSTLGILGFNLTSGSRRLGIGRHCHRLRRGKDPENLFGGISVLATK